MMDWSPQCHIPSLVEIDLLVLEKKIFKGFYLYGHGGHLGHVTSIMSSDFYFLVPESFHKIFCSDPQSSFREKQV